MKGILSTAIDRPDGGLKGGQGCVVDRHRNNGIESDCIVIDIPSGCRCMFSLLVWERIEVRIGVAEGGRDGRREVLWLTCV